MSSLLPMCWLHVREVNKTKLEAYGIVARRGEAEMHRLENNVQIGR